MNSIIKHFEFKSSEGMDVRALMQPASKESLYFLRCRSQGRWDIPTQQMH